MEEKDGYIVYENMVETSTHLIKDIEYIIDKSKKDSNNDSNDGGSSNYSDNSDKDWFFDKNYYLVPMKNIHNQLKYNDKMEYYSDSNAGLDKLIKSFRSRTPTKIVVGAMLKGKENEKVHKIIKNNIVVKQKDKKQELYLDIALISPEYMDNIKKMLESIMITMRQEIEIHRQNAIKKYQDIMAKQIGKQKMELLMIEKDKIVREKIDIVSNKAKQKINSILNIIKKFLHLFANKPTKVIDDFVNKMNKNFQLPVSISFDENINFDQKIAECSGKLIQESLKFIRGIDESGLSI